MNDLLELAERCEAATAEQTRDLLIEAHLAVRGMARFVRREFSMLLEAGAFFDAAITLVPEGVLRVQTDWIVEKSIYSASINARAFEGASMVSAALALCAAALRAQASRQSKEKS